MKFFARAAIIFLFSLAALCTDALAVTVEQTQIVMPKIDIYVFEDGVSLSRLAPEDITASLDGEPLEVRGLERLEQGIFYVYMLDVSASIPQEHFSAAKQALRVARSRLREQDRLALITFGNEVTVLLQGGESREALNRALEQLENKDHNTMLYNAMDSLIEMMLQTSDMRRVAVVISDGLNDTGAGMTQTELEEKLIRSGVSVSAMCIDTVPAEKAGSFGDFIRLSGGELYLFGALDAQPVLDSLLGRLEGGWHLGLEAASNIASGRESLLKVDFGTVDSLELSVIPERWTPDDAPPYMEKVTYRAESNSLLITFSEPVEGALNPDAYALSDGNGAPVNIGASEVVDGLSVLLTLAEPPGEVDSISLTVRGIFDVSMEKNPLSEYSKLVWSQTPQPVEFDEISAEPSDEPLIGYGTIIVLAAVTILIVAAVLVILKLSHIKYGEKKKKPSKKQKIKSPMDEAATRFMFLTDDKDEDTRQK